VDRKRYIERFRRHRRELREVCLGLGVEFQPFVTDRPVLDAIRVMIRRRGK